MAQDGRWLVVVNDRVVGRAALPLQAVRRAEAIELGHVVTVVLTVAT